MQAMRNLTEQSGRSVPAERQHGVRVNLLENEHGLRNGLGHWFTDRLSDAAVMTHGASAGGAAFSLIRELRTSIYAEPI